MKKMCENWVKNCDKYCLYPNSNICPKNTNAKCEIIAKKKKMVRVKAWACVDKEYGRIFVSMKRNTYLDYTKPCTIIIDRKYLKGAK
jgi:hypothetical protein